METKSNEWISVAELQEWLGIGRSKSYELLRSGQIKSHRIRRVLRIRRRDVEAWLEANETILPERSQEDNRE